MLTRLCVRGFKNLVNADVRFGPFTCIAGPNGVGKSNLFDAILFLRDLADKPFVEAAASVRGGEEDVRRLFTPGAGEMRLLAEMLIPSEGRDDFGQQASATSTFVEYELVLGLREAANGSGVELELRHENLTYISKRAGRARLGFRRSQQWLDSVFRQKRYGKAFISTNPAIGKVMRHQDLSGRSSSGRPLEYPLGTLPRTVLSSARSAQECRTAVLVRREMQGWHLLQLEPSAMRAPDSFTAPDHIAPNGAHLPATLYRLVSRTGPSATDQRGSPSDDSVLARLANRLSELVPGVRGIRVERDDQRRLYWLLVVEDDLSEWPAASLSDGTLRFLALAMMEEDPMETGVVCMEEPENGVHPARVEALLTLLQDIAVDPSCEAGPDNPLRQVIINTHSPVVAGLVEQGDLLFAQPLDDPEHPESVAEPGRTGRASVVFRAIEGAWRSTVPGAPRPVAPGVVLSYLQPVEPGPPQQRPPPSPPRRNVRAYARDKQMELALAPARDD